MSLPAVLAFMISPLQRPGDHEILARRTRVRKSLRVRRE
jgi:hypothetical protein